MKEQFTWSYSVPATYSDVPSLKTIRTLVFENPRDYAYFLEQKVTGGLGYLPVRKQMRESKVHSSEGLQAHLAMMDICLAERESHHNYAVHRELFRAIKGLEKSYRGHMEQQERSDKFILNALKETSSILQERIIPAVELAIEKTEPERKEEPKAREARPWYKRIFGEEINMCSFRIALEF
jgi:hypothetical protein